MYAKDIIIQRLELAQAAISPTLSGFRPEYHSKEEVQKFTSKLQEWEKRDEKGDVNFTRDLTPFEHRFITNEKILCTCDAGYYLTRYAKLLDDTNTSVQFKFRDTQRIFYKIIADMESKGFAIELIVGKGRQQGITTIVEQLVGHRAFFHRDINAITASADRVKSEEMGRKVLFSYDNLPWWLRRKYSRRVETIPGILEFDSLNSRISIQHGSGTSKSKGGQKTGIGRGTTPTVYHLSEVSAYPNPEQQIEAAIFKAVHASPKVFGVLESTFAGDTGWFPKKYKLAKDHWESGRSRLRSLFFHWPCARDLYPTNTWLRMHPIQDWDIHPLANKIKEQITKAELFMRSSSDLSGVFGTDWVMPIEQQWKYFVEYFEHYETGSLATFLQEMPCLTGDTRISTDIGITRLDQAMSAKVCESGEITRFLSKGTKPTYMLITVDGRNIRGTADHKFLTKDGWKEMSQLNAGDSLVLTPPMFAITTPSVEWSWSPICDMSVNITEELSRFLGYFMGDGCFHSDTVDIAVDSKDGDIIQDVLGLFKSLTGGDITPQVVGKMHRVRGGYDRWFEVLKNLGCLQPAFHKNLGRNCGWKRKVTVPDAIFKSPKHIVRQFLSAVFECDGHASTKSPRVKLYSKCDEFLSDIQLLLLGFGIKSKFMAMQHKNSAGRTYTGRSLEISSAFANKFYDEIGFISARKQNGGKRQISSKWMKSDELVDRVVAVCPTGVDEPVYDISVKDTHRFSANGLTSHNCDDIEAMQSSYDNVFGKEAIYNCNVNRDRNFQVYSIVGTAIDAKFDPADDEIDYSRERIMLAHTPPREDARYRWELIPLKTSLFEDLIYADPSKSNYDDVVKSHAELADGKFFVYPEALQRDTLEMSLGVDTSNGISQDSTVIAGATKGNGLVPDVQMCEFRSANVNHVEAFAFVFPIALFMRSLGKNPNDILRWPWIGIEQIAAVGDTCQVQLRRMGYPLGRFFRFGRYDSVELNKKSSQKVGWYTVRWSRDLLVGYFIHAIQNGWYKLNSPFTIDECRTFEVHYTTTGKEKMEHSSTGHDDGIFGNAIATFINHDLDTLAERGNKKLVPQSEDDMPEICIRPNFGLSMSPDTPASMGTIQQLLDRRKQIERFRY